MKNLVGSSITSISKYSETSETKHAAKNSPLPEDDDVVHNHNTPSSTTKDSDSQITNSSSENPNPSYETSWIMGFVATLNV